MSTTDHLHLHTSWHVKVLGMASVLILDKIVMQCIWTLYHQSMHLLCILFPQHFVEVVEDLFSQCLVEDQLLQVPMADLLPQVPMVDLLPQVPVADLLLQVLMGTRLSQVIVAHLAVHQSVRLLAYTVDHQALWAHPLLQCTPPGIRTVLYCLLYLVHPNGISRMKASHRMTTKANYRTTTKVSYQMSPKVSYRTFTTGDLQ